MTKYECKFCHQSMDIPDVVDNWGCTWCDECAKRFHKLINMPSLGDSVRSALIVVLVLMIVLSLARAIWLP